MRFVADYKESVDAIMTLLKKSFTAAMKVTEMVKGDAVLHRS